MMINYASMSFISETVAFELAKKSWLIAFALACNWHIGASFLTLWTSLFVSTYVIFENQHFIKRGEEPGGEAGFIRRIPPD